MRQMTGLVDEHDPCAGNGIGKFPRVGRINDAIGSAPDNQRRRRHAVNAILESAIGDRPDELAGAGLGPDELCQRINAPGGIARHIEKALRSLAVGIGEQRSPAGVWAQQHPVLDRQVIPPQSNRVDQRQPANPFGRRRRKLGGDESPEGMAD